MKLQKFRFYLLLAYGLLLISTSLNAQISEDFEKGDLSKWKQFPSGHWKISSDQPVCGTKSLRQYSDSVIPSDDRISIRLNGLSEDQDSIIWKFRLRHGSNPSSSNRWAVYLAYDEDAAEMHPGGAGEGYAIGIDMNSSDDYIKLFKVSDGSFYEFLNTKFNWETTVGIGQAAAIEIKRLQTGQWDVFIGKDGSFDSLQFIGSAINNEVSAFLNFGIFYDYTSTRNGMLWFDEFIISAKFIADTIPPYVRSLSALNDSSLSVTFSEFMNWDPAELKSEFLLSEGNLYPGSCTILSKDSLLLTFKTGFKDDCWLHLQINDLKDLYGNKMKQVTDSCYYSPVRLNDISITEIMPDPSPVVRLPEYEYLELLNRSNHKLNLMGWTISSGDIQRVFPSFIMEADEYIILCQTADVNSFSSYGRALGLFTSASFLSNSGSCIRLCSTDGTIISQICYSSDWITDVNKKDGGWSLEKIDPGIPCSEQENWTVSKDKTGGSPGRQNSVFKAVGDKNPPRITGIFPDTDSTIVLSFSETVGLNYIASPSDFRVDHETGPALSCSSVQPEFLKFRIRFKNHFKRDTIYTLQWNGEIQDCAGNKTADGMLKFQLPAIADSLEVVINEVMYHPVSGCPEFIELYNRSTHAFNLGDFRIGLKDIYSTDLKTISDIFPENRLFMPGEYIVLTSDANRMNDCYPHTLNNAVAEFRGIPALTDDGQKLQILSKDLSVIDEMSYKDAMQFALLSNSIGVSLERVNYDRSSKDPGNWHSASSASGYCTPGYQNSQFTDAENSENILRIEPEVFSPNNDGIADIVNISYCFKEPGFTGNLFVYDSKGRQVRRLANNELLASKGQFSWDGTSDSGSMAEPGIYIVCFEVFNLSGKTGRYKKVCVISRTR